MRKYDTIAYVAKHDTSTRWSAIACTLISLFSGFSQQASGIFLPLFANDLGASKLQLGVMGGIYGAAYLASSLFFGRQSDMRGRLQFIRLGFGLAAISYAAQVLANTPVTLMLYRALVAFCLGISDAALMAYNFEMGGRTNRFTSLGALGWLLGGFVAIFIQSYRMLFFLSAISCAGAFGIAWTLKKQEHRKFVRPVMTKMIGRNAGVYIPFLLRTIGGNMVGIIFPLFLVTLGASKAWIAILQCMNTGAQSIVMLFVDKFKASRLYFAGFFFSIFAFAAFGLATNYFQIIPVQVLMAVSWSCLYVGALMLLFTNNEEKATSAGVLFSTASLAQTTGPFIGGFVAQLWGYQALMFVSSGLSVVGLAIISGYARVTGKLKDPS
jgi:MFS family permease